MRTAPSNTSPELWTVAVAKSITLFNSLISAAIANEALEFSSPL